MTDALMHNYARFPVEFVRGEGAALWDSEGNRYLDFLAGISVCNTGHCHPAVLGAIAEQSRALMHVSNLFYTRPRVELAGRLSRASLGGRVTFANSGDDPGTARTVEIAVEDGDASSAAASKALVIAPLNDAPTVTTTAAADT